jgi:hypothetical protein
MTDPAYLNGISVLAGLTDDPATLAAAKAFVEGLKAAP